MYNFSGIVYRIYGVSGIMLLLGIVLILFQRPWRKNIGILKCKFELLMITVAIIFGLFNASRILFPDVSSYTGEFVNMTRNSRVAPPLPLTNQYVFWNGDGKKQIVYLDILSKDKIYPFEFEKGQEYTVYFDKFTKVIVGINPSH